MKKNNLTIGLAYVFLGTLILVSIIFYNFNYESIVFGLGFALIASGLGSIIKYIYWSKPKNIKKYKEIQELEEIELEDERKEKLRNISGRYSYIIGLVVLIISILVCSLLSVLGVVKGMEILIIYLFLFLIFQYVVGVIIFKKLDKKY